MARFAQNSQAKPHLTVFLLGYIHGSRVEDAHAVQPSHSVKGLNPLEAEHVVIRGEALA